MELSSQLIYVLSLGGEAGEGFVKEEEQKKKEKKEKENRW